MNYAVQSSLNTDTPIMLLNKHIGYDAELGMGINGADFERELMELDGHGYKRIKVWINSPGGVVTDGYSIYNAILKSKTPVDTYCTGMCASIAAVIFLSGRNRVMNDYGRLMFHNPFGGDDKKALDSIRGSIVTMVASRAGKPETDIAKMMDKTSWIAPEDALASGLCDTIEISSDHNLRHGNAKAFWQESNAIVNKILNLNTDTNMSEIQSKVLGLSLVANYLGLNTDATETSVLTEIKNRFNQEVLNRERAESTAADRQKALDKMKSDLDEMTNKYNKAKSDYSEFENRVKIDKEASDKAIKDAADAAAAVTAKVMVEGYAKTGRIQNKVEVIEKWTLLAVKDFAGTEAMIKELPLNKDAAVIETEVTADADQAMSAAYRMAQIQNKLNNAN